MILNGLKILMTREFPSVGVNLLADAGAELYTITKAERSEQSQLLAITKNFDVLFCSSKDQIDGHFLQENKHLKLISQFAAGVDNIDLATATQLKIPVGHTPNTMTAATSDIAFGLMIAVSRNFFQMHKQILNKQWKDFEPTENLGIELYGKTLGVFGLGSIGHQMALKCKAAYGMKIIYHNRTPNLKAEKELNALAVSFDELLRSSDIISVHADLNPSTYQIFNKEAFEKMKPSSLFINTARGKIHDEKALINAIKTKQIWGAGLDVTHPEPMSADNELLNLPNVCVLPHIGSATITARNSMSTVAAQNILNYFEKGQLLHCANPQVIKL